MKNQTTPPAKAQKQRPIRFTTVEAFAAAYMELHGQTAVPQPNKTGT